MAVCCCTKFVYDLRTKRILKITVSFFFLLPVEEYVQKRVSSVKRLTHHWNSLYSIWIGTELLYAVCHKFQLQQSCYCCCCCGCCQSFVNRAARARKFVRQKERNRETGIERSCSLSLSFWLRYAKLLFLFISTLFPLIYSWACVYKTLINFPGHWTLITCSEFLNSLM